MALQNPPCVGIDDVCAVVPDEPQVAPLVVEQRFDMDADGISLFVCQPDRLHAPRPRVLVHQLGVRVGQPDAPVALLDEIIDAQWLSRDGMVHVQVGKTPLPLVEDPHSAVERRDQQPVVLVVPQLFDHV